ncbi:MAG: outer membrane beta-barrel protein [Rhodoblastus sp.]
MRKFLLASVALASVAAAGAATAADLPSRRAPSSYEYAGGAPVFTWTGFYLGLNAGYGWGSFTNGSEQLFGKPSGFEGGVTGGFNWQAAQNFVLGIEGDWDLTGVNNHAQLPFFGFNGGGKLNSLATIRGRAGFAADRALIYVTGGLAMGSVSVNVNDWRAVPFFGSSSQFSAGWALGAGLEYAFTDRISGKAEYLFTSLGSKDLFTFSPDWVNAGLNVSQIRAGVNYHF